MDVFSKGVQDEVFRCMMLVNDVFLVEEITLMLEEMDKK